MLVGCSDSGSTSVGASPNQPVKSSRLDYVAQLTRTDSAEICTRRTHEANIIEFGEGFISEENTRKICECRRDAAFYFVEKASPRQPVLHNAVVQVTTNFDVMAVILNDRDNPNKIEAFESFLQTESKATLGFDAEEFHSAIKASTRQIRPHNNDPYAFTRFVPACNAAMDAAKARFPEWDPKTGEAGTEAIYAIQRLKYDSGIDLADLDEIVSADNPNAICRRRIGAYIDWRQQESRPHKKQTENDKACRYLFNKLDQYTSKLTDQQALVIKRIVLSEMYFVVNKTTAQETDMIRYWLSALDEMGWTDEQILASLGEVQSLSVDEILSDYL